MGTITALLPQKRTQERINVHLDGQYAFSLSVMVATAAHLKVGQSLSSEQIAGLQAGDSAERAKQSALRFLSYRPRSVAEVRQNLRQKGNSEPIVEQVVNRLLELELLDDYTFAQYWVEQRETFKPRSHFALRQELAQKGVDRDVIDEVLAEVDETAAAQRAAAARTSRWSHLPHETFSLKMGRYLQQRGFNYTIIKQVTQEAWEALSGDTTVDIDQEGDF